MPDIEIERSVRRLVGAPVFRFCAVGVASTFAYAVLFLLLRRGGLGAGLANVFALATTAVANTAANRRLTFGVRGRTGLVAHHVGGFAVFLLTVGLTMGALAVLGALDPSPSRAVELTVLVGASLVATVTRFVALRSWVFADLSYGRMRERPLVRDHA
ncbi:MAG: hypothetical protein QOF76_947 [Solirubrobacteraceae bacterium]|jgi:putative flippase GtrA|nr:hypothetical protein [Solirubrobacteraceae bacterium]